jgi:hypothetical protein
MTFRDQLVSDLEKLQNLQDDGNQNEIDLLYTSLNNRILALMVVSDSLRRIVDCLPLLSDDIADLVRDLKCEEVEKLTEEVTVLLPARIEITLPGERSTASNDVEIMRVISNLGEPLI